MVSTDPIADMLTRIRNAIAVRKTTANVPYSNLKHHVASVLKDQGYVQDVTTEELAGFKRLVITINEPGVTSKISHIQRVSKPGRRMYAKVNDMPKVLNGRGVMVVSTSQGIMSDREARAKRLGGELICEVY